MRATARVSQRLGENCVRTPGLLDQIYAKGSALTLPPKRKTPAIELIEIENHANFRTRRHTVKEEVL